MHVRRGNDQIARLPVQERLGVELGCRSTAAVRLRVDTPRRRGVADVEQRELHAGLAAVAGVHPALPDPEQQVSPTGCGMAEPGIFSSPTTFGAAASRRSRT